MDSIRQTFGELVIHTPHTTARMDLPWTFSTFDYRTLCEILWEDCEAGFETAKVDGRARPANGDGAIAVATDRGVVSAPLVVDASAGAASSAAARTSSHPTPGSRAGSRSIRRAAPRSSRSGSSVASSPPVTAGASRPETR